MPRAIPKSKSDALEREKSLALQSAAAIGAYLRANPHSQISNWFGGLDSNQHRGDQSAVSYR